MSHCLKLPYGLPWVSLYKLEYRRIIKPQTVSYAFVSKAKNSAWPMARLSKLSVSEDTSQVNATGPFINIMPRGATDVDTNQARQKPRKGWAVLSKVAMEVCEETVMRWPTAVRMRMMFRSGIQAQAGKVEVETVSKPTKGNPEVGYLHAALCLEPSTWLSLNNISWNKASLVPKLPQEH